MGEICRSTIDAIVDTGTVTLVLPQNVVERLGLEQRGTAFVTYPTNAGRNDRWRVR